MKAILTTKEAANHLDTDPQKVRRWCREGYLPSVKLGREYRISTAALIDWWEEQGGGRLQFFSSDDDSDQEKALFKGLQTEKKTDPNESLTSDKNEEEADSNSPNQKRTTRKIIKR